MNKKKRTNICFFLTVLGLSLLTLGAAKECDNRSDTCGSEAGLQNDEECDDGDLINDINAGDGCSWECKIEDGWTCTGSSISMCNPVCSESCSEGLACLEDAHCASKHCIPCQEAGRSVVDDLNDMDYGSCEDIEGKRAQKICVQCVEDAHCETGYCNTTEHICAQCSQDSDCPSGRVCGQNGQCEEPCGNGEYEPAYEDCDATAPEWDWTSCDAYCERIIYTPCDFDDSCPNGLQCIFGFCTVECSDQDAAGCAAPFGFEPVCVTENGLSYCTVKCDIQGNCLSGLQCSIDRGICVGTVPPDPCDAEPCENGVCVQEEEGFVCDCAGTGFTGDRCQDNIDDCPAQNPCEHGGVCIDGVNGFTCDCAGTGFTGDRCEIETDSAIDAGAIDASVADAPSDSGFDATDSNVPPIDSGASSVQIIANHTACDNYNKIPDRYISAVKKMWINIPGESHSFGYRVGLALLANLDNKFRAVITESGEPEAYREDALRISRLVRNPYEKWNESTGEEGWYTNSQAIDNIKRHIQYCQTNALDIAAIGFAWCWDMTWHNDPGGGIDPRYKVRWAGSSEGGPDGDLRWGLDSDDYALTGNHVSMETYLAATQQYVDFCKSNGYATKVLFTTGPVDGSSGESGYQRHLKHDAIRRYVIADRSRILFDYADILAWNDAGEENLQEWIDGDGDSHSYQMIHPDNMVDLNGSYSEDGDHIGERGALRLGKAIWWLLARIAGWDGD